MEIIYCPLTRLIRQSPGDSEGNSTSAKEANSAGIEGYYSSKSNFS